MNKTAKINSDIAENINGIVISGTSPLVMIVDDDTVFRSMAKQFLEHNGYRVIEAESGLQSIDYAEHDRPDMVLLDVDMMGIDGVVTCQQLSSKSWFNAPIIVVSGVEDNAVITEAFDSGADEYITKPVNWLILKQRIQVQLKNRQYQKEKKQALHLAKSQEIKTKMIIDAAGEAIIVFDSDGVIEIFNKSAERTFGYHGQEIMGQGIWKLIGNADEFSGITDKSGKISEVFQMCEVKEMNAYHGDGTQFPVRISVGQANANGQLYYTAILQDVSELKLAQDKMNHVTNELALLNLNLEEQLKARSVELYESEERFKLAVQGTGEGIWDWHIAHGEMYFSDRWKEMLGYDSDEIEHTFHAWQRLIHPDDLGRMLVVWADYIDGEIDRYQQEYRMRSKLGDYLWVESRGICLFDEENRPYRMAGSHTDISERKSVAKALERKNRQLSDAYKDLKQTQAKILQQDKMASIGLLAAGVAHEINNPTGFILSNLGTLSRYMDKIKSYLKSQYDLILEELGDNECAEKINVAIRKLEVEYKIDYVLGDLDEIIKDSLDGVHRIKTIVQDLKSFSRVEASEKPMLCDLNEGIESTTNIAWNEIKYRAKLVKDYGDIPMTKVRIQQLNQVFLNMLVNAAHAIEDHGHIYIKTWCQDNDIYLSFRDTGKGIAKHNLKRIFEPFFTTKEVGKGTGLGLSISYDIVKKHHGDIIVQSEIDIGTTFVIKIPVVQ